MCIICDTCKYSDSCSAKNDVSTVIEKSYSFRDCLNYVSDTYSFIKCPSQITIKCERYAEKPKTICDRCIHKKVCKFVDQNPAFCIHRCLDEDDKT